MKVIVAGASSFMGTNFILRAPKSWKIVATYRNDDFPKLIKKKKLSNITPVRCDFTDKADVKRLFRKHNDFDLGLFLIANTSTFLSVDKPEVDFEMNTMTLLNFLEHFRGKRLIFFSSGAVYDTLVGKVPKRQVLAPRLPYAISKLASELYIKYYCLQQKTFDDYAIIRFFGAYGPYELERKIYTRLIQRFYLEGKNDYHIYGAGRNLIDAMYIDDAIDAVMRIARAKKLCITLDLCVGKPVTINRLVKDVAKIFKVKGLKIYHEGISAEPVMFIGSDKEMKKYFGFHPKTTLKEGMLKFARFLKEEGITR